MCGEKWQTYIIENNHNLNRLSCLSFISWNTYYINIYFGIIHHHIFHMFYGSWRYINIYIFEVVARFKISYFILYTFIFSIYFFYIFIYLKLLHDSSFHISYYRFSYFLYVLYIYQFKVVARLKISHFHISYFHIFHMFYIFVYLKLLHDWTFQEEDVHPRSMLTLPIYNGQK